MLNRGKKTKYKKLLTFVLSAIGIFGVGLLAVQAQVPTDFGVNQFSGEIALGEQDIRVTVARIIRAILGLLGILAVGIVLYGGFVYMTAGGNEEKVATARKILINGAIGLAIILASFSIAQFVLNKLGEATGATTGGGGGGSRPGLDCEDLGTCPDDTDICSGHFFIKSLTPRTRGVDDGTGMNNVVVRAVFSKPIDESTELNTSILLAAATDPDPTQAASTILVDDNYVLEAFFEGAFTPRADLALEDAEDESVDRWSTEGPGATVLIQTDPDPSRNKVISFSADDTTGRMVYAGGELDADSFAKDYPSLRMDVNSNSQFEFEVSFESPESLNRVLVFSTRFLDFEVDPIDHTVGHVPLGDVADGAWQTIIRDLTVDFDKVFPGDDPGLITDIEIVGGPDPIQLDNMVLSYSSPGARSHPRLLDGDYTISVREDIVSDGGQVLEIGDLGACGFYPASTEFKVDQQRTDSVSPAVGPIAINGSIEADTKLAAGGVYPILANIQDDSGVGYAHLKVEKEDGIGSPKNVYDGPLISRGSSGVFMFRHNLVTPGASDDALGRYLVTLTGYDIDRNFASQESSFVLEGWHCANGVMDAGEDEGEEGIDCGGPNCRSCPGSICETDSDCSGWARCLPDPIIGENQCVAYPVILDLLPWSGAGGNFVTVSGQNFGESGQVRFGEYDVATEAVTNWFVASHPLECGAADLWHDDYVVVKVPDGLPTPSLSVVEITVSGNIDTTIDDFGPNQWEIDDVLGAGLFQKNNIIKPGLCAVSPATGLPRTDVLATGVNFDSDAKIYFGGIQSDTRSVNLGTTPQELETRAPRNMDAGRVAVQVEVETAGVTESSNGVYFTVQDETDVERPGIGSIDPTSTTRLSYVTIFGSGFGTVTGEVWAADSQDELDSCGDSGHSCVRLEATLPDYCGDTWLDHKIIVQIPGAIAFGDYFVGVKTNLDLLAKSSGTFEVVEGDPFPSICKVDPSYGPAPLPTPEHDSVEILGENFPASDPLLYYWKEGALANDVSTWFNSASPSVATGACTTPSPGNCLSTRLPGEFGGETMPRGFGFIKVSGDTGQLSNADIYQVEDCRDASAVAPVAGYQCCQAGPEAGFWKPGGAVCAEETRTAGYAWRFTSGKIPQKPSVVEECLDTSIPSPTPWVDWDGGDHSCLNASVVARFNVDMDATTFDTNSVELRKCTLAGEDLDCPDADKLGISVGPANYSEKVLTVLSGFDDTVSLEADTWYQVRLLDSIMSHYELDVLGSTIIVDDEPLSATRSCGDGTAYCFAFKTSETGRTCTLVSANINPPDYTTNVLGRVVGTDRGNDLEYRVYGRGDEDCRIIDVSQEAWDWQPFADPPPGSAFANVVKIIGKKDRVNADALRQTAGDGVDITAALSEESTLVTREIENINILEAVGLVPGDEATGQSVSSDMDRFDLVPGTTLDLSFTLDDIGPDQMISGYYQYRTVLDTAGYQIFVYDQLSESGIGRTFYFRMYRDDPYRVTHYLHDTNVAFGDVQNYKVEYLKDGETIVLYHNGVEVASTEPLSPDFVDPVAGTSLSVGGRTFHGTVQSLTIEKEVERTTLFEHEITATSPLYINLGDPSVVGYWPNCIEGCLNAEIGARFDREMYFDIATGIDSYTGNAAVYKCDNSTCGSKGSALTFLAVDTTHSTNRELVFYNNTVGSGSPQFLDPSSWYLVELTSGIKAVGGRVGSTILAGDSLENFKWRFRTNSDNSLCVIDRAEVDPISHVATIQGEKTSYWATPFGAPDQCSRFGQALDAWAYDWEWGTDAATNHVADVTNFESGGARAGWCTGSCLPRGSDVGRTEIAPSLCGNNQLEAGEDCDIGIVGTSGCERSCLLTTRTNTGSTPLDEFEGELTGDLSVCGDGLVTAGEDCDVGIPADKANNQSALGCSRECLHTGTVLAAEWCTTASCTTDERNRAISVCGNGVVEDGEECDGASSICNDQCLLVRDVSVANVCGTGFEQVSDGATCGEDVEGCAESCTLTGSSLLYSESSVCGDGETGIGEFAGCDLLAGGGDRYGLPNQIVTAIGDGNLASADLQYQQTEIRAKAVDYILSGDEGFSVAAQEEGSGDYFFQCGYEEIPTAPFNSCPLGGVEYGVASNSCCYQRPFRDSEYPVDGAGGLACQNTAINAVFNGYIDKSTVNKENILLTEKVADATSSCTAVGLGDDVSLLIASSILEAGDAAIDQQPGFWPRVWRGLKSIFSWGWGKVAHAAAGELWCVSETDYETSIDYQIAADGSSATSTIRVNLKELLKPNTDYAVLIKGGSSGVADDFGIGIRHANASFRLLDDSWRFTTDDDICKLKDISVDPAVHLFNLPFTSSTFSAVAESVSGDEIQQISGVYDWDWQWIPANNPLFDIPAPGFAMNVAVTNLGARNLEGTLTAFAKATVTVGVSGSDVGRTFTGATKLVARFCSNIWPARTGEELETEFVDPKYNFSMSYCADAGIQGTTADDLPFLKKELDLTAPADSAVLPEDVLKRYLFFSDNPAIDDAIGIQIFENPDRDSARDWYSNKFPGEVSPQSISIDGYDGVVDGDNYYINALNRAPDGFVYNNIYLFSINDDAQASTRDVFAQLLDSLKFNINIPDYGLCFEFGEPKSAIRDVVGSTWNVTGIECQTDFDCRDQFGNEKATDLGVKLTNGRCANARTKLLRDWRRLHDVQAIQGTLVGGSYPALVSGTYYPGYTMSRWPSWRNTLAPASGASILPVDELNQWTACAGEGYEEAEAQTCWNAASSTYNCPAFGSVYEYEYIEGPPASYKVHTKLEYFAQNGVMVNEFIDRAKFDPSPWCSNEPKTPFGEGCGDGLVEPSEQCDPPGVTRVAGCPGGVAGSTTSVCNDSCKWEILPGSECRLDQVCGNGVVEEGTIDEVCDDGDLNGTYGHCATDCRSLGAYCGNNNLDTPDEFCDADNGVCQYVSESGTTVKPQVLIVLDRSLTMRRCVDGSRDGTFDMLGYDADTDSYQWFDGGRSGKTFGDRDSYKWCNGTENDNQSRWYLAVNAIQQVVADMGSRVDFKFEVFGASEIDRSCATLIDGVGDLTTAGGTIGPDLYGTPTKDAVEYISNNFDEIFDTGSANPKMVVLVTDGAPVNSHSNDPVVCSGNDQANTKVAIEELLELGVSTYVVGFGSGLNQSLQNNLNAFAEAGGTDNPPVGGRLFYPSESTDDLVSAFEDILSCSPYSRFQRASCAYDCKAYGSYCGDGVTDIRFDEECDDGNTNNADSCHNNCSLNTGPAPDPVALPGECGDGEVDEPNVDGFNEECDFGTDNGIQCTTSYGTACTYCSNDCRVLTKEAVAYCGNGVIDYIDEDSGIFEACDVDSGQVVKFDGPTLADFSSPSCGDMEVGKLSCSSDCTEFIDGCFECSVAGATLGPLASAIPRIKILNPMIGTNFGGDGGWGFDTKITFLSTYEYRILYQNTTFLNEDYVEGYDLTFDASDPDHPERIISENLCRDKYKIEFNSSEVLPASPDRFDYAVRGEEGYIDNEHIVSPAVPDGTFRVVVRWTDDEADRDVKFSTMAYSGEFVGRGEYSSVGFLEGTKRALIDGERRKRICRKIDKNFAGYWLPDCNGFFSGPGGFGAILYVHDISNLSRTFSHSLTINTGQIDRSGDLESMAVFVQAMSADANDGAIIAPFVEDSNLTVEVYDYHDGQVPAYSIYAPTSTFKITGARGTSNSPTARYWHVFNLIHNDETDKYEVQLVENTNTDGTYQVAESGSIENGFCDILRNIGTPCP